YAASHSERIVKELSLGKYRGLEKEAELLLSSLSALQEKAHQLEVSLSAETRVKLDLFSALGDARRRLQIAHGKKPGVVFQDIHDAGLGN
uniref:Uncharacterized protein n=1 Tax=Neogobius melanostomus TaxID=47308 RepID=A0A8C6UIN0_9GOBI